jgi:hypothetical protein
MNYLVFSTESDVIAANAFISAQMGYPNATTIRWGDPVQILDGRWILPAPSAIPYLSIPPCTLLPLDYNWFPPVLFGGE